MKTTAEYYDDYSHNYDKKRKQNYHVLINQLQEDLLKRYCNGKKVLDAGCGTGAMLNRIDETVQSGYGIDLSGGMLKFAKKRNSSVVRGNLSELPFKEKSFDIVYSFKVLAHVPRIRQAIDEMARVVNKNGYLILEFYNPYSIRYLVKILKKPSKISDKTKDDEVYTRYDNIKKIREIIPDNLKVETSRGFRIFTPFSFVHNFPIISTTFKYLERIFCATYLKYFAGFMVVILRRKK